MIKQNPKANEKDPIRKPSTDISPRKESDITAGGKEDAEKKNRQRRASRNFVPIIMSFALILILGIAVLQAQVDASITLQGTYSDNVFQLSDDDFSRFDDEHPNLGYVETTDDLTLSARFDLAYPLQYRWWKVVPSITGTLSQNASNKDKNRQDMLLRMKVQRHYWDFTILYGFYPYVYVRSYVDSDGTGELEKYSYERNLYRADLNLRPLDKTTLRLHARTENYYYNQYFTEFDGRADTFGMGFRQAFPVFTIEGTYYYRIFENKDLILDPEDCSYESNLYAGSLRLKAMPLNDSKPKGATWYPSLALSYEERFYQSDDSWYGGRIDMIYNTKAGINFKISPKWNLILDYTHVLRNVDSPNASVMRLKEYRENRFAAAVKYDF
ncbi:MAG: hypothetical protein Q8M98_08350 [Candidatus Cloacimonadaceae bacterium]|nr:hypothetical protein [Candidatus Cloacimonadaceae bacterium]